MYLHAGMLCKLQLRCINDWINESHETRNAVNQIVCSLHVFWPVHVYQEIALTSNLQSVVDLYYPIVVLSSTWNHCLPCAMQRIKTLGAIQLHIVLRVRPVPGMLWVKLWLRAIVKVSDWFQRGVEKLIETTTATVWHQVMQSNLPFHPDVRNLQINNFLLPKSTPTYWIEFPDWNGPDLDLRFTKNHNFHGKDLEAYHRDCSRSWE